MTTDARFSTTFMAHPKTRKLRRRLGAEGPLAFVGLVLFCAANRTDGDLSGMSDEDLEIASDFGGDPGSLVPALVDVGFLEGEPGAYRVHDLADHNPYVASAAQRSARARAGGIAKAEKARERREQEAAQAQERLRQAELFERRLKVVGGSEAISAENFEPEQNQSLAAKPLLNPAGSRIKHCSISISNTNSIPPLPSVEGDAPARPPARGAPSAGFREQLVRMRGAPAVPIPADWSPSEETRTRCQLASCPPVTAEHVERFQAHFESTGELLADWQARFRKWMFDERDRARYRRDAVPPAGQRLTAEQQRTAALEEFARREAEREAAGEVLQ